MHTQRIISCSTAGYNPPLWQNIRCPRSLGSMLTPCARRFAFEEGIIPYVMNKVETPIIDNLRVLANMYRLNMQMNIFEYTDEYFSFEQR